MKRGGGRKRPMDWVVQGETYGLDTPPYILDAFSANDEGELLVLPLTGHDDIQSFSAARHPQLEQTAVRVVGTLVYAISGFDVENPPAGSWNTKFHARIGVTTQQIDTPTPSQDTALQYDMRTPTTANDDFLWEYVDSINYNATFWGGTGPVSPKWVHEQRVAVDVRVSRRLKQREVLCLFLSGHSTEARIGGGAALFQASPDLRIWVEPVFRTLVRTIT